MNLPATDVDGPQRTGRALRVCLFALLVLGLLRCLAFFGYATAWCRFPHEAHPTEAQMVHLAWRVQSGVTLYPQWIDYPHVANFFTPFYFWVVGGIGRGLNSSLEQLFMVGRAVTLASAALLSMAVFWHLRRVHGARAAVVGAILCIGASPMFGFAVMARPDLLADTLGLSGFLVLMAWNRRTLPVAAMLLALACLTKQTAGIYLLAAVATCLVQPARRSSCWPLCAWSGVAVAAVLIPLQMIEPHMLGCLLGEGASPFSVEQGVGTWQRLLQTAPDVPFFVLLALFCWRGTWLRNPDLFVLALSLVLFGLCSTAKIGSDLNYFLGLRGLEALFVGSLFSAAAPPPPSRPLVAGLLVGALLLAVGANHAWQGSANAQRVMRSLATSQGQELLRRYREVVELGNRADLRLLTDTAVLAVRQRERAPFVDSFLFRLLVDSGQIEPRRIEQQLRDSEFDVLALSGGLVLRGEPGYESQVFSLPDRVARVAREHYAPIAVHGGITLYGPRRRGSSEADSH